jgi:hypothetical protein
MDARGRTCRRGIPCRSGIRCHCGRHCLHHEPARHPSGPQRSTPPATHDLRSPLLACTEFDGNGWMGTAAHDCSGWHGQSGTAAALASRCAHPACPHTHTQARCTANNHKSRSPLLRCLPRCCCPAQSCHKTGFGWAVLVASPWLHAQVGVVRLAQRQRTLMEVRLRRATHSPGTEAAVHYSCVRTGRRAPVCLFVCSPVRWSVVCVPSAG